jgi:hypothetical protein
VRHFHCKCGANEWWGEMPLCARCKKCGASPYGDSLQPHEFVTRYDERTGEPFDICRLCLARKDRMSIEEAARTE